MAEPARIGGAAAYVTVEELLRARLSAAIGGWRGALESAVPTIAFVVLWTVTRETDGKDGSGARRQSCPALVPFSG